MEATATLIMSDAVRWCNGAAAVLLCGGSELATMQLLPCGGCAAKHWQVQATTAPPSNRVPNPSSGIRDSLFEIFWGTKSSTLLRRDMIAIRY